MRVEAKVIATEFLSRTYFIECGDGKQKVHWIATSACQLFGQDHHPSGIYIPNLLTKIDDEEIIHPQTLIHKSFQDGDKVEITLKDRSRDQTSDEKIWYNQAFGKERHIMKINIVYFPKALEAIKNNDWTMYVQISYSMYPELHEEFKDHDYKEEFDREMETIVHSSSTTYFSLDIDLPYGEVSYKYVYRIGEEEETKELPDKEYEGIQYHQTPTDIVSQDKQRELDMQEEEEIKKREKELRNTYKQAIEKDRKEALDRHNQALKQQENSLKLDVYWRAMVLDFHPSIEDANAALSILSVYYDIITDNFSFYASLQSQPYRLKENEFISLHSFMHFLKLYGIATTKDEIKVYCDELKNIIIPPPDNVLNIKNGLNFAQFLEAILRIVYYKAKNSDHVDNEETYRLLLQQIFQDATISMKTKAEEDPLVTELYAPESQELFYYNFDVLGAVYQQKAINKSDVGLGLTFDDFYVILEEAGE